MTTDEVTPENSGNGVKTLIVTTGGTIDKVYFDAKSDYEVGASVVGELLEQAHVHLAYELIHLMRKDSLELNEEDRQLIRQTILDSECRSIIVTHGTDTMSETAAALADIPGKTIVLTGALAPARFARSDATFNVGMAIAVAQMPQAGVYIVMNGQVFDGLNVRKDRSRNRFVATNTTESDASS